VTAPTWISRGRRNAACLVGIALLLAAPAPAPSSGAPAPRTAVAPAPSGAAHARAGTGVRTLYLVRHGLYDEVDPRDPDVGKHLVPEGREQARLVAERLAALPVRITALHASTMTRARETAEVIAKTLSLRPRLSTDLRECTPPFRPVDFRVRLFRGEQVACRDRIDRAFARYFRPSALRDSSEVLVCHGNVIRYLCCRALGIEPHVWNRMWIANCSLTTIQIRPDGTMKLVGLNDVGHLPPSLQTYAAPPRAPAGAARN